MNTPHETTDSIERSAYDSAMSEEVKEKSWEIEFDERFCSFNLKSHNLCSKCKPFDGSSVADGYGSADEYIKDFIRTQRSLAQQEGYEQCKKELLANRDARCDDCKAVGYSSCSNCESKVDPLLKIEKQIAQQEILDRVEEGIEIHKGYYKAEATKNGGLFEGYMNSRISALEEVEKKVIIHLRKDTNI